MTLWLGHSLSLSLSRSLSLSLSLSLSRSLSLFRSLSLSLSLSRQILAETYLGFMIGLRRQVTVGPLATHKMIQKIKARLGYGCRLNCWKMICSHCEACTYIVNRPGPGILSEADWPPDREMMGFIISKSFPPQPSQPVGHQQSITTTGDVSRSPCGETTLWVFY